MEGGWSRERERESESQQARGESTCRRFKQTKKVVGIRWALSGGARDATAAVLDETSGATALKKKVFYNSLLLVSVYLLVYIYIAQRQRREKQQQQKSVCACVWRSGAGDEGKKVTTKIITIIYISVTGVY